jgi:hypothetical protein
MGVWEYGSLAFPPCMEHTYDVQNVLKQLHIQYESICSQWKRFSRSRPATEGETLLQIIRH